MPKFPFFRHVWLARYKILILLLSAVIVLLIIILVNFFKLITTSESYPADIVVADTQSIQFEPLNIATTDLTAPVVGTPLAKFPSNYDQVINKLGITMSQHDRVKLIRYGAFTVPTSHQTMQTAYAALNSKQVPSLLTNDAVLSTQLRRIEYYLQSFTGASLNSKLIAIIDRMIAIGTGKYKGLYDEQLKTDFGKALAYLAQFKKVMQPSYQPQGIVAKYINGYQLGTTLADFMKTNPLDLSKSQNWHIGVVLTDIAASCGCITELDHLQSLFSLGQASSTQNSNLVHDLHLYLSSVLREDPSLPHLFQQYPVAPSDWQTRVFALLNLPVPGQDWEALLASGADPTEFFNAASKTETNLNSLIVSTAVSWSTATNMSDLQSKRSKLSALSILSLLNDTESSVEHADLSYSIDASELFPQTLERIRHLYAQLLQIATTEGLENSETMQIQYDALSSLSSLNTKLWSGDGLSGEQVTQLTSILSQFIDDTNITQQQGAGYQVTGIDWLVTVSANTGNLVVGPVFHYSGSNGLPSWAKVNIKDNNFGDAYAVAVAPQKAGSVRVPVLMYHQVQAAPTGVSKWTKGLYVTPAQLERQMAYLVEKNYKTIDANEFNNILNSGKNPSQKTIMLTFDDGNYNNYSQAFPILRKYGLKAVFYIVAGKRGISAGGLREMANAGMAIESHTLSHPDLRNIDVGQQWSEIQSSRYSLEYTTGRHVYSIAYPGCVANGQNISIVRASGYVLGFSCGSSVDHWASQRYTLSRLHAFGDMTSFKKALSGVPTYI